MLLKVLRRRSPLFFILIPLLAFLLWLDAFSNPISLADYSLQMPLYQSILCALNCDPLSLNILGYLIIVLVAFGLIRLNEHFVFIKQRTDLPSALFILIASCATIVNGLHPALIAALLLLLSLNQIFKIYHGSQSIASSFDVGFLIGLATLFYLQSSLFIIWFIWALIILGAFRLREMLAGIIGFITPLFFMSCWYFWQGNLSEILEHTQKIFSYHEHFGNYSTTQILFWVFLALLSLFSIFFTIWGFEEKRVRSRKYLIIIVALFITTVGAGILFPSTTMAQFFIAAVPLSYILSYFFVMSRNTKLAEIIFGLFILGCIFLSILK